MGEDGGDGGMGDGGWERMGGWGRMRGWGEDGWRIEEKNLTDCD